SRVGPEAVVGAQARLTIAAMSNSIRRWDWSLIEPPRASASRAGGAARRRPLSYRLRSPGSRPNWRAGRLSSQPEEMAWEPTGEVYIPNRGSVVDESAPRSRGAGARAQRHRELTESAEEASRCRILVIPTGRARGAHRSSGRTARAWPSGSA